MAPSAVRGLVPPPVAAARFAFSGTPIGRLLSRPAGENFPCGWVFAAAAAAAAARGGAPAVAREPGLVGGVCVYVCCVCGCVVGVQVWARARARAHKTQTQIYARHALALARAHTHTCTCTGAVLDRRCRRFVQAGGAVYKDAAKIIIN